MLHLLRWLSKAWPLWLPLGLVVLIVLLPEGVARPILLGSELIGGGIALATVHHFATLLGEGGQHLYAYLLACPLLGKGEQERPSTPSRPVAKIEIDFAAYWEGRFLPEEPPKPPDRDELFERELEVLKLRGLKLHLLGLLLLAAGLIAEPLLA